MRKKLYWTDEMAPETETQSKYSRNSSVVRWEKLDNAAHLFPVIAGEKMTNVYRLSAILKEPVIPELLQQALDIVLPQFDGFNMRVRYGVFWRYFEENGNPAPPVREEFNYPCRFIRPYQNNEYLFRVTYYRYRINLEVFHVLADGSGGFNFLKELVYQYLRLKYPDLLGKNGNRLSVGTTLNREDGFQGNFRKNAKLQYKSQRAYRIGGERLPEGELGVMHGYMQIPQLKEICRRYGASINEYLVACYTWSIYKECLNGMPSKDPVRVAVPVNLRSYFESNTTKNFFSMISAEFHPREESYTFEQVLREIQTSLHKQMNRDHLEKVFSYSVAKQKNPLLRLIPLPLKGLAMRQVYGRSAMANTSTITNVGSITVVEPYQSYIDMFSVILPISKGQSIKGAISSYKEKLVFTFSYHLSDTAIQRRFFHTLVQDGVKLKIETNGVHYG